ncbi:hypothetical protein QR680_001709 [Steinernema hermaphroditum]|uniref:alpha,alpha-trehalose-phosphate synthase (UDP-forming) n=1 Tax=Steinernema hermaphroditum TaxID=289476 RepID=A0AA39H2B6_9BILA|nr:hypothetical protein QR680_001709 [Steinernema hermaphroditum]
MAEKSTEKSDGLEDKQEGVNWTCEDEGSDHHPVEGGGKPFQRPLVGKVDINEHIQRARKELTQILEKLEEPLPSSTDIEQFLFECSRNLCQRWKARDKFSEIALKGLLIVLEFCLMFTMQHDASFDRFLTILGYNTVAFWRVAVPQIYDSDLSSGTHYRDALLFSLALYDVNNSKNRLRELYAAVPGVRQSMLGVHAKRFGEKYRHIQISRSRTSSRMSSVRGSSEDLLALDNESAQDTVSAVAEALAAGGLADTTHHKQRVINVSNAPPVSVSRKGSGCWEIKQGSGGLVACVDPVMSGDKENIWLANLGFNPSHNDYEDKMHSSTNSLGLPLIKRAGAGEIFHVLEEDRNKGDENPGRIDVERDMSLLSVLHDYNKTNYQLNPVIVSQDDYNAYYGGISNGLLWPALHNLSEYIVAIYDTPHILREHWCAYVRVNYQFALNAVRNSRPQDFIWIHDYHLMLTGQLMRSLDSNLEVGFFLHIPFQPPDNWMTKYRLVAEPILRAILRFTKVGFQTHRDREKYVQLVRKYVARVRIRFEANVDIYTITHEGWTCSLGVFPVSIKNEDFLQIARDPQTAIMADEIRKNLLANSLSGGCIFFSVERFDYTKGIYEKLKAWRNFFNKYPERIGRDVLFQVAVTNRRSVESYRHYQDACVALANDINEQIRCPEKPDWRPLKFETDGLPRPKLIAHYLAMDVGVVTPRKDGMNLVAKEMMICNPSAALMLSTGAGTEVQLGNAGFYQNEQQCYFRIEELGDVETFSDTFYRAATETEDVRRDHGARLNAFLMSHDIDEWSSAFLDPSWTHDVIRPTEVLQLADFYQLMDKTCHIRRQIVERVLKGIAIRTHFKLSLENARDSLLNSCENKTHVLLLETTPCGDDSDGAGHLKAKFDVTNELNELEKDLTFLEFIQSDDINNVEQFVDSLGRYHPKGSEVFSEEVKDAFSLLTEGDHFHYFFTDRDGTLKSYSCSYPASIQPAYSAVIQAQFARRCAQFCAIVTTAPLMHIGILNVSSMPEGYYAYGASAGREWYMNPSTQFKDDTVNEVDLALLNRAFDLVEDMLETPEFRNFTWMGSGLQKHYGLITIAKQDVNTSISKSRVSMLRDRIAKIVKDVDPSESTLTIKESDYDIKIYTKAKLSGKIFNKGHGIRLIQKKLSLKLNDGRILLCGDSETDLPMLEELLAISPENVYTIWVTNDAELKMKVKELCTSHSNNHFVFVSTPEVLLGAMAQATVRIINIRPGSEPDDEEE